MSPGREEVVLRVWALREQLGGQKWARGSPLDRLLDVEARASTILFMKADGHPSTNRLRNSYRVQLPQESVRTKVGHLFAYPRLALAHVDRWPVHAED